MDHLSSTEDVENLTVTGVHQREAERKPKRTRTKNQTANEATEEVVEEEAVATVVVEEAVRVIEERKKIQAIQTIPILAHQREKAAQVTLLLPSLLLNLNILQCI